MRDGRTLQIFRDGRRNERKLLEQIPPGAAGNLETLAAMKQIVVEDSQQSDLKAFVMREIIKGDKGSLNSKIDAAFNYCRDKIVYDVEKPGFQTLADLWSSLYALNPDHGLGNCAVKSVALATCLCFLDLVPAFVAVQQIPGATWFNHVFVSAKIDGKDTTLDATPPEFRVGMETNSFMRLYYPVF